MTNVTGRATTSADADTWTVATAKAHFSAVLARARTHGPQLITRNGQAAAVIVATEEWERKTRRSGSLADFFAASPLRGVPELVLDRRQDRPPEGVV
ncbi:MAG: type II toxin-antitoxin system Phd/YefM family antitoxin [Chloroflexi bacterium]|nr:type II toxin-antitoxin system Phd/YefM family antitoxin [Chloroflexota bacterium]